MASGGVLAGPGSARGLAGFRHVLGLAAAGAVGAASLVATQGPVGLRAGANGAAVLGIAFFLMRGERRRDALRRSRLLLLIALATALVSAVLQIGYSVVVGHNPPFPWVSDAVALCYVPFAVVGLLAVPVVGPRVGSRARAFTDGALAASSLWYLLLTFGVSRAGGEHGWAATVTLAYPLGDVFVLAAGLTVLARCAPGTRRFLVWLVAGMGFEAVNDIWGAVAHGPSSQRVPWLLFQAGLLVMLVAALTPPVEKVVEDRSSRAVSWAWGVAPFLPLFACMVMTMRMVVDGSNMPHSEVIPALFVAAALAARQFAASADRQRLVMRLLHREKTLESALRRDHLTGLANRLGMTERMEAALRDPVCWPVAIALLDLNDFKLINDNHGHQVGDAVLKELSVRLAAAVRQGDMVARLGGDEFAVVATGVDESQRDHLSTRLLRCFDEPVEVGGRRFTVGASIGVVVGRPPETATDLLADADAAMYEAKEAPKGPSRVRVLTDADRARVWRRLRIQEGMSDPQLEQFHVMYQPVVDLETGCIRGMEALARWDHPDLGSVPPDVFIPLAEQAGSITLLGDHVLATAIGDLAVIQEAHPHHRLAVGVNVSPRQLATTAFVDRVLSLVDRHRLAADQIVLEITEQAFETDLDPVVETVERLAESGVSIAVDDFGTGYSSLRYLERLRLEIMKIDRTFVANLVESESSRDLVTAVAAMGSALGLQIIAEGIETEHQLALLRLTQCELGQGYLFSKPVTASEFQELIGAGHVFEVGERAAS